MKLLIFFPIFAVSLMGCDRLWKFSVTLYEAKGPLVLTRRNLDFKQLNILNRPVKISLIEKDNVPIYPEIPETDDIKKFHILKGRDDTPGTYYYENIDYPPKKTIKLRIESSPGHVQDLVLENNSWFTEYQIIIPQ